MTAEERRMEWTAMTAEAEKMRCALKQLDWEIELAWHRVKSSISRDEYEKEKAER